MKKNYFLHLFLLFAGITFIVGSGSKAQAQCNPELLYEKLQTYIANYDAAVVVVQERQADVTQAQYNLNQANKALAEAQKYYGQKNYELNRKKSELQVRHLELNRLVAEYNANCSDPNTKECQSLQSQINSTKDKISTLQIQIAVLIAEVNQAQQAYAQASQAANSAKYQINLAKKRLGSAVKTLSRWQAYVNRGQADLNKCCQEGGDYDGDGYASVHCGGTDCDDQNATVYPGAIDLCGDGIDNDCDGEIDETLLEVTASECAVSYYGYGPQQGATISASATGGSGAYTYTWSNNMTGSSIDVDPTETTTYTVTVTDPSGCTGTATVTVYVIDVRCGKKNDKVMVCHSAGKKGKTKTLCIGADDVADHLGHGDQLGSCDSENPCENSAAFTTHTPRQQLFDVGDVQIYPNPARDQVTVSFEEETENYTVTIMDGNGRTIKQVNGSEQTLTIDLQDFVSGMYFIHIQSQQDPIVKKFIITD